MPGKKRISYHTSIIFFFISNAEYWFYTTVGFPQSVTAADMSVGMGKSAGA